MIAETIGSTHTVYLASNSGLPWWLSGKGETQETWVWSLGPEDPLEKEMAIHYSALAWRIPQTEEPGGYSPWGHTRAGHAWAAKQITQYLACIWCSIMSVNNYLLMEEGQIPLNIYCLCAWERKGGMEEKELQKLYIRGFQTFSIYSALSISAVFPHSILQPKEIIQLLH